MAIADHKSLLASFEQVKVMGPRVGVNKAAVTGACHNFSLSWISLILTNPLGSAKDRMASLSQNAGGANLVLQKTFGDRWTLEGAAGADDMMCQLNGILTTDAIAYGAYDYAALKRKIVNGFGLAFLYSFWFAGGIVGAEGGAHSVAFNIIQHNVTTAIHFFDPNFGEFLLTSNELDAFWIEFVATYGPMRNHWLRSCVATAKMVIGGR
jgi:Yersinia/Haemophilus virulence surface antigen